MAGQKGITDNLMEVNPIDRDKIQDLRPWFHPKDRSVYLAANTLVYLNNGAYLSNAFIAETILSGSATSVTFSNIPQGFRHLQLFTQSRTDRAAESDNIVIRFNGDSGTNYDLESLESAGATVAAAASRATATPLLIGSEGASSRGNNFAPGVMFILGYSNAAMEKRMLGISSIFGNLSADTDLINLFRNGLWRSLNVVTSVTLLPGTGPNFVAGSRFQLYGVL